MSHNVVLLKLKTKINLQDPNAPKPICIMPSIQKEDTSYYVDVSGWLDVHKGGNGTCKNPYRRSRFSLVGRTSGDFEDGVNSVSSLKCFESHNPSLIKFDDCKKGAKTKMPKNQLCVKHNELTIVSSTYFTLEL